MTEPKKEDLVVIVRTPPLDKKGPQLTIVRKDGTPPPATVAQNMTLELTAKVDPPGREGTFEWTVSDASVARLAAVEGATARVDLLKVADSVEIDVSFTEEKAGKKKTKKIVTKQSCTLAVSEFMIVPNEVAFEGKLSAIGGGAEGEFKWEPLANTDCIDAPFAGATGPDLPVVVKWVNDAVKVRCTWTPSDGTDPVVMNKTFRATLLRRSVGEDIWARRLQPANDPDDVQRVTDRLNALGYPLDELGFGRSIQLFQAMLIDIDDCVAHGRTLNLQTLLTGVIRPGSREEQALFTKAQDADHYYSNYWPPANREVVSGIKPRDRIKPELDDMLTSLQQSDSELDQDTRQKWDHILRVWDAVSPWLPESRWLTSGYRDYRDQRRLLWANWTDGTDDTGTVRVGQHKADDAKARIISWLRGKFDAGQKLDYYADDSLKATGLDGLSAQQKAEWWWDHYMERVLRSYHEQGCNASGAPDEAPLAFKDGRGERFNPDELRMSRILGESRNQPIDPPGKSKHQEARAFDVGNGLNAATIHPALWCAVKLREQDIVIEYLIAEKGNGCLHFQFKE